MKTSPLLLATLLMLSAAACMTEGDPDDGDLSSVSSELKGGGKSCRIDGVSYVAGATNPADVCQSCEPATSAKAWTVLDPACYAPPPPTTCESARDCNGQACIEGVCGACTVDSQCAPPLVCRAGACVL